MAIEATFVSRCPMCDESIEEGEWIECDEDGEWCHKGCVEEAEG